MYKSFNSNLFYFLRDCLEEGCRGENQIEPVLFKTSMYFSFCVWFVSGIKILFMIREKLLRLHSHPAYLTG